MPSMSLGEWFSSCFVYVCNNAGFVFHLPNGAFQEQLFKLLKLHVLITIKID